MKLLPHPPPGIHPDPFWHLGRPFFTYQDQAAGEVVVAAIAPGWTGWAPVFSLTHGPAAATPRGYSALGAIWLTERDEQDVGHLLRLEPNPDGSGQLVERARVSLAKQYGVEPFAFGVNAKGKPVVAYQSARTTQIYTRRLVNPSGKAKPHGAASAEGLARVVGARVWRKEEQSRIHRREKNHPLRLGLQFAIDGDVEVCNLSPTGAIGTISGQPYLVLWWGEDCHDPRLAVNEDGEIFATCWRPHNRPLGIVHATAADLVPNHP